MGAAWWVSGRDGVVPLPTNPTPPPPNVCLINMNADWMGGCELEIEDTHAPFRLHWSAVSG